MANVGSAAAGKTLIGAGNGASPTYASIGTNSGLTAHGVVISEGNSAFSATSSGTVGQVLTSNGSGSDPSFQTLSAAGSLTPDSGAAVSAVGGTIPTLGYQAGTVQTTRTYNDGAGNFRVADQTWYTQYVVDASTTPGLKGTFQTIQAALDQAVTDGMAYTNQKVIYVRVGSYSENLTIPGGAILVGETLALPIGGVITPLSNTIIIGNHTFSGISVNGFNNLVFEQTVSGDIFNGSSATAVLGYAKNCTIINTGSGQILNGMTTSSSFNFVDCTFFAGGEATQFTCTNMASMNMQECTFANICDINQDSCANLFLRNCTGLIPSAGVGTVTMGSGTSIQAIGTWFITNNAYNITGTNIATGDLKQCTFVTGGTAGINTTTGAWLLDCCSTSGATVNPMFSNPATVRINTQIQGNIIASTLTAGDLTVSTNMYYIGVTSTASARTIDLPTALTPGVTPTAGQVFIIKDQSGGAATNNITVTTTNGLLIDGSTTALINTNYGSLSFKFDGTNYFIL